MNEWSCKNGVVLKQTICLVDGTTIFVDYENRTTKVSPPNTEFTVENFNCNKCGVDKYWEWGSHVCRPCPVCDGYLELSKFKDNKLWGRQCRNCGYEEIAP